MPGSTAAQGRAVSRSAARRGVGRESARVSRRARRVRHGRDRQARQGLDRASTAVEQDALLRDASTADVGTSALRGHFQNLKDWIAGAYYSSETACASSGGRQRVSSRSCPGARIRAGIRSDRFSERHHADDEIRRDRGGLGRLGRMGGQAAVGSRHQGRAPRSGEAAGRRRLHRARAGVRPDVSRQGERADAPHAAAAARLLRLPRVELQVVRQRSRRALHRRRTTSRSAGRAARASSADAPTSGAGSRYRLSEQDLHGKSFDGYGEDWPIGYKDLVPYYDLVEDYVGISGQAENVPELPDSQFHPAMPMSCAETQLRTRVKSKLGWTVTIGRAANITQADQRPRAVPLLRAVRAGLRDALVLQRRVHDGRRRAAIRATRRSSPTRWSTRS